MKHVVWSKLRQCPRHGSAIEHIDIATTPADHSNARIGEELNQVASGEPTGASDENGHC
jgi:hypothetical protein